jgi:hypothetical protein
LVSSSRGSTKEDKHGIPCEHRRAWKLAVRGTLLPTFWQVTNELSVDVAIGEGVTCGNQFPMQLRNIVTTSIPTLCNLFEVGIEPSSTLGRFLFRKGAMREPA